MLYNSLDYLLNTIVGILTMMFLLRFFMQLFRASFKNPLGQMVIALTDFAVKPTRKLIPSVGKIDLSTLLLAVLSQLILQAIVFTLHGQIGFGLMFISMTLFGLIRAILDLFFYMILLQAILSWVNPYTAIGPVLNQLCAPILRPIQRTIPPINGIDFSPAVALILIQLINIAVLPSIEKSLWSIF